MDELQKQWRRQERVRTFFVYLFLAAAIVGIVYVLRLLLAFIDTCKF